MHPLSQYLIWALIRPVYRIASRLWRYKFPNLSALPTFELNEGWWRHFYETRYVDNCYVSLSSVVYCDVEHELFLSAVRMLPPTRAEIRTGLSDPVSTFPNADWSTDHRNKSLEVACASSLVYHPVIQMAVALMKRWDSRRYFVSPSSPLKQWYLPSPHLYFDSAMYTINT